jgi:hypothetical protein
MEERARHLGGTFHIDSRPGRGTLLRVTLPLAAMFERPKDSNRPIEREPKLDTEVVWNGGLADGADSHSAG